jgi:microcystin-dependent protein
MCQKCGKNSCNSCSGSSSNSSSANTEALLAQVQDQLQEVLTATNFLLNGHPILIIEDTDDIASFDFDSGKGFGTWQGWAVCDGQSHLSSKKKNVATPNFIDRFIVMAGGTYDVGDTGGASEVTLTTPQIPVHSHTLTDPGHIHAIDDDGHTHGLTQSPHTHPLSDPGHTHDIPDHSHGFTPAVFTVDDDFTGPYAVSCGSVGSGTNYGGITTDVVSQAIDSSNTGISMDEASISISAQSANTGIEIEEATTGITIGNAGEGEAHNNLPPYFAAIFIKYIG